jgi:hypothetical protein
MKNRHSFSSADSFFLLNINGIYVICKEKFTKTVLIGRAFINCNNLAVVIVKVLTHSWSLDFLYAFTKFENCNTAEGLACIGAVLRIINVVIRVRNAVRSRKNYLSVGSKADTLNLFSNGVNSVGNSRLITTVVSYSIVGVS